ncbi:MAG: DUF3313 family protein, partial [Holophagae bacterium]
MLRKFTLITCLVAVLVGIAGAQEAPKQKIEVTGGDELEKQKSRHFDELWVRPDADFASYSKLFVWQPVFEFRDVSGNRVNTTSIALSRGDQGPYTVDPADQQRFADLVTEVIQKEFARSTQFTITDTIGPNTLIVRPMVLDITSNVPPNVGRPGNIYLSAMGEATFAFEIIDAETGVIQARTADRRLIQPRSRMNEVSRVPTTRATVWN